MLFYDALTQTSLWINIKAERANLDRCTIFYRTGMDGHTHAWVGNTQTVYLSSEAPSVPVKLHIIWPWSCVLSPTSTMFRNSVQLFSQSFPTKPTSQDSCYRKIEGRTIMYTCHFEMTTHKGMIKLNNQSVFLYLWEEKKLSRYTQVLHLGNERFKKNDFMTFSYKRRFALDFLS